MEKNDNIKSIKDVTLLITTRNRLEELKITLKSLEALIRMDLSIIICDDGSTDSTFKFLKTGYPSINVIRNDNSRGLIYSRNRLLNMVDSEFAISLDDDANFLSENPLQEIITYFQENKNCAVASFRIFWSKQMPEAVFTLDKPHRVQSFVGCGHAWRMEAWNNIPDYPDWFIFYGEEDFASFQLFKKNWEVHYLPQVLVHHRVDVKARSFDEDYIQRLRYSLRAGWFLYFLFLPVHLIPRKIAYSVWRQLKLKVFKRNYKVLKALSLAFFDLFINMKKILNQSERFSKKEYLQFMQLNNTKIYWNPGENVKNK